MAHGVKIKRKDTFTGSTLALFHWLHSLTQPEIGVLDPNTGSFSMVDKKPEEIISFDFDFDHLESRFYTWSFSSDEYWELTADETLLFLQCCHAGHFYLEKQDYYIGEMRDRVNWLYEQVCPKIILNSQ